MPEAMRVAFNVLPSWWIGQGRGAMLGVVVVALLAGGCPGSTGDGDGNPPADDGGTTPDGPFPLARPSLKGSHRYSWAYVNFCRLAVDGHVTCFGQNMGGENNAPEAERFTKIDMGVAVTCGITEPGDVLCWGHEDGWSAGPPRGEVYVDVAVGFAAGCALTDDGELRCWGDEEYLPTALPEARIEHVRASLGVYCGIRADDHSLVCWGQDLLESGLLSPPAGAFRDLWMEDGTLACALREEGGLACWGYDKNYTVDEPVVRDAPTEGEFLRVELEYDHGCGLLADETVVCWGDATSFPVFGPGPYADLASSYSTACALRYDDTIACRGALFNDSIPPPDMVATTLDAGRGVVCGLDATEHVSCWGDSENDWPAVSAELPAMERIAAGDHRFCGANSATGLVSCYGDVSFNGRFAPPNAFSDLAAGGAGTPPCGVVAPGGEITCWGDEATSDFTPPVGTFVEIDSGNGFLCALDTAGTPACWGYSDAVPEVPVQLAGLHGLSCDWEFCCALHDDGTPTCWGGYPVDRMVLPEDSFESVVVGWSSACGLTAGGALRCWGENRWGEADDREGPFVAVAAYSQAICVQGVEGSVECFGGVNETTVSALVPTRVSDSLGGE